VEVDVAYFKLLAQHLPGGIKHSYQKHRIADLSDENLPHGFAKYESGVLTTQPQNLFHLLCSSSSEQSTHHELV
jgi:hypothetical protein